MKVKGVIGMSVQVSGYVDDMGGSKYRGLSTALRSGRDGKLSRRDESLDGRGSVRQRCRGVRLPRVWAAEAEGARPVASALPEADLQFYRKYTEALLRRYLRLRLQAGRVPSRMDREMFRGRMSHYRVEGFDDRVIFCVDVERCVQRLNAEDQRLLKRIAIQQYSMGEAAAVLGLSLRSCVILYGRALDRMTRLFLGARLLTASESLSRGGETQK